MVCLTGQVPTHLIGNDAFQECDTVGITRPCTKHNYLVKDVNDLARILHEAFYVATHGRPGPVVVDIPKDVQFATGKYVGPKNIEHKTYRPRVKADQNAIRAAVELIATAKRPILYTGGGVINSGVTASKLLREFVALTDIPITSTLMGLGAYPASGKNWLGMLGMHGTYEANMAMHDCDVMINVGARFDDRITGRLNAFSPGSKKIHIDIDPSSINKTVRVDIPVFGDAGHALEDMIRVWKAQVAQPRQEGAGSLVEADRGLEGARLPQIPRQHGRDHAAIRDRAALCADPRQGRLHHHRSGPAPDVGGAVLQVRGAEPLDDVGRPRHHGLWPAGRGRRAGGASQIAGDRHRRRCLGADDHAGNVDRRAVPPAGQDLHPQQPVYGHGAAVAATCCTATACRKAIPRRCPISSSWRRPMAAWGCGPQKPAELDGLIKEMIKTPHPVIFDCRVASLANCFPMIPSGKAHNEMLMGEDVPDEEVGTAIDAKGKMLV